MRNLRCSGNQHISVCGMLSWLLYPMYSSTVHTYIPICKSFVSTVAIHFSNLQKYLELSSRGDVCFGTIETTPTAKQARIVSFHQFFLGSVDCYIHAPAHSECAKSTQSSFFSNTHWMNTSHVFSYHQSYSRTQIQPHFFPYRPPL